MKADIKIPLVENVFLAAVQEWSDDFMDKIWYAYLILSIKSSDHS